MQQDKLCPIEKENLKVIFTQKKFVLSPELQNEVDNYWNELIKKDNKYTRGEVFTLSDIKKSGDKTLINVDLSDYAHYLYTRRIGLSDENACKNLHTSCLIETSDNVLVFGRMGNQTSVPGNLQCVGGGLDGEDVRGNTLDLEHNSKKELLEEVGVDVDKGKMVNDFGIKYLRHDSKLHSVAAIFILKLKITAKEFSDLYAKFETQIIADGKSPEFGELVYLSKNKLALNNFYEKEKKYFDGYLLPLLQEVIS